MYDEHLFQYTLSPTGRQVIGIVINHNASGKGLLELHLFGIDGQPGPTLSTASVFANVVMPEDERFLAYISGEPGQLALLDLANGQIQPFRLARSGVSRGLVGCAEIALHFAKPVLPKH